METIIVENNGLLYIKKVDKYDLQEDKFNKIWFHTRLDDKEKFDPKLSYNICEKLVNQNRLKLEYPGGKIQTSNYSLW